MKRALLVTLLLCAVATTSWFEFHRYTTHRMRSEPLVGDTSSLSPPRPNLGAISSEDEAVEKVNGFLISRVGEQFFGQYISFNNVRYDTGDRLGEQWRAIYPGIYGVAYYFNMPQYPFVEDEIIEVRVAPDGDVLYDSGIPDPQKCVFISEAEAIAIAKAAGLEESIEIPEGAGSYLKPLMTSFHYYSGEFNTYAWSVGNVTHIGDTNSGESVLIDAYSGKILRRSGWRSSPGYYPRAPEGMLVSVLVTAVYVYDDGWPMHPVTDKYDNLGVAGVEITVTDEEGNSQTRTTSAVWQGRPEAIRLEMLSGHTYTITASFNNSSSSILATVKGYYSLDNPEGRIGGSIKVTVWHSSNTIAGISYYEPMFV